MKQKLWAEMDAGEQREWLTRRIAFGGISASDFHGRVKTLARRIGRDPEKVRKDIMRDASLMAGA